MIILLLLACSYLEVELLQPLSCDPLWLLVSIKAVDEVALGILSANLLLASAD